MITPVASGLQKTVEDSINLNRKLIKGFSNMLSMEEIEVAPTPKELVYEEDKMKLYHYIPTVKNPHPIPLMVTYALVNREYMLDIQADRSVIKGWLDMGLDIYIIDWGYPDQTDKYVSMEDYIDSYMNNAVDTIRKRHNVDKINMLGICQGGTMSVIYASLYPEKVKNICTMVTPFDFSTDDGLLFSWSRHMNIDNIVDTLGVVPGHFMNAGFNMLKPFALNLDKYVGFMENMDKPEAVKDFLRMEKWIYDSPNQAGEMLRKFVKDLYQENKLAKNELEVGGRVVNVKNLDMPLLNIIAEQDHLVPPAATRPLNDAVGSKDKQLMYFKGGHIGVFVSSRGQKEVAPAIANWFKERGTEDDKKAAPKKVTGK